MTVPGALELRRQPANQLFVDRWLTSDRCGPGSQSQSKGRDDGASVSHALFSLAPAFLGWRLIEAQLYGVTRIDPAV
jgi:hypothetical protein